MKKYTKTAQDIALEKSDMKQDRILIFLKFQAEHKFNIGDILIRQWWDYYDGKWMTEKVSYATDAPKKYMYVFENSLGIGYVKQFKVNGELVSHAACITAHISETTRLVLDPEYIDHLLLGGDEKFDPTETFKGKKKFRDQAIAKNKKLILARDLISANEWVNTLKVGDEFYKNNSILNMSECKVKVVKIKKVKISSLHYDTLRYIKELKLSRSDTIREITVEEIKAPWAFGQQEILHSGDICAYYVTDKEPFPLTETEK